MATMQATKQPPHDARLDASVALRARDYFQIARPRIETIATPLTGQES